MCMARHSELPTPDSLVKGRVYRLASQRLRYGVWDGVTGFIGVDETATEKVLEKEVHWDSGEGSTGTVEHAVDTEMDTPPDVPLKMSSKKLLQYMCFISFRDPVPRLDG